MKRIKIIISLFFIYSFCYSQTIINAESLIDGVDSTIYSFSLSYSGSRGNLYVDQVSFSPSFILLKKNNDYKLFGSYNSLTESGNKIMKGGYVHLRHNYNLTKRIKTFEFYQLQFNEVLLLNKREVFGAGLRFNLINKDSLYSNLSVGIIRELEVLDKKKLLPDEAFKTIYYRANAVLSVKFISGKIIKLTNVIYYQPFLKNYSDFRLLNDFILSVSITKHFNLNTSITTRFDSKPPSSLEKLDNMISVGVNLKF